MLVFSTNSSHHLAKQCATRLGLCTIKHFSDGELFVRIDEDVRAQDVWVLSSTQAPADNLLELFFLLDALQQAGARIHLFIPYFGYARQINPAQDEARGAQIVSSFLHQFKLEKLAILQVHSPLLHNFLSYQDVHDVDFFCRAAQDYDALVAPDKGAFVWAQDIAKRCNKELIVLTKTRPNHDQVNIVAMDGKAQGKRLLIIDDIISTGHTLIESAEALKSAGATQIAAAAIHGVFSPGAIERLEQSILTSITVTNSIKQHTPSGKIKVEDIGVFISATIETLST
jgi:ribose-phosphate pyrophosphokinase